MPRHRPDARNITRREQHGAVVPAGDLIHHINHAADGKEPHEREMPLQGAAKPSTERERLRYIEQNLFWNLRAETRERAENPEPAGDQYE